MRFVKHEPTQDYFDDTTIEKASWTDMVVDRMVLRHKTNA